MMDAELDDGCSTLEDYASRQKSDVKRAPADSVIPDLRVVPRISQAGRCFYDTKQLAIGEYRRMHQEHAFIDWTDGQGDGSHVCGVGGDEPFVCIGISRPGRPISPI
jgi:hypothetical protein